MRSEKGGLAVCWGVLLEVSLAGSVCEQGVGKTGTGSWVDLGPQEGETVGCPSSQLPWVPARVCSSPASSEPSLTRSSDDEGGRGDARGIELLVHSDPPLLFSTGIPETDGSSSSSTVTLVGLVALTAALVVTVLMFLCMR